MAGQQWAEGAAGQVRLGERRLECLPLQGRLLRGWQHHLRQCMMHQLRLLRRTCLCLQAAGGAHAEALGEDALHWLMEAGSNDMVTRARGWAGASHWRYRALPQVGGLSSAGWAAGCCCCCRWCGTMLWAGTARQPVAQQGCQG